MTATQPDFTAARVLAVAARDAAVRLRDELQRQRESAADDDRKVIAAISDYADYLIAECNAAIGQWTRSRDLLPPPSCDDAAFDCDEVACELPECVAGKRQRTGGCGERECSAAAAESSDDAIFELAKRLAERTGGRVRVLKF